MNHNRPRFRLFNLLLDGLLATELAQTFQHRFAAIVCFHRLQSDAALDLLKQFVMHVGLFRLVDECALNICDGFRSENRFGTIVTFDVTQFATPFDLLHHVGPIGPPARPNA